MYIYLTAIGLLPGGSRTVHLHKQYTEYRERNIHNNKKINKFWEVRAVLRLCELYPGICHTTEEKHGKTSVRVAARTSQAGTVQYKNNEQYNTQQKQ
jgi:hypothetical protein